MKNEKLVAPAVKYFFKRLEQRSEQIKAGISETSTRLQEVPFEQVEGFFRQIMSQNIFIHTVGMNGKRESTILAKAVFSMNKIVRVYYCTSFDDDNSGFIRVRPDSNQQLIIVERLHGIRPKSEVLYASSDQCHVIRFMVRWLMRRIDWDKTKLSNLDLYKRILAEEQQELQADIEAKIAEREAETAQIAVDKYANKRTRGIRAR
jgi:hypothetical protein